MRKTLKAPSRNIVREWMDSISDLEKQKFLNVDKYMKENNELPTCTIKNSASSWGCERA